MSHIQVVQTQIKSLPAFEAACSKLGLTFHRGTTSYRSYYSDPESYAYARDRSKGSCQHMAELASHGSRAFQVGIIEDTTTPGAYKLIFDSWGRKGQALTDVIGEDASKLLEEYTMRAAIEACNDLGWMAEETPEGLTVYPASGGTVEITRGGHIEAMGMQGQGCGDITTAIAERLGTITGTQVKPEFYINDQRLTNS